MRSKTDLEPCKQIQPRVRGISPVGKEKVYGGNDLPKSRPPHITYHCSDDVYWKSSSNRLLAVLHEIDLTVKK